MVTGGETTNSLGLRMESTISKDRGLQSDLMSGMQGTDLWNQKSALQSPKEPASAEDLGHTPPCWLG